MGGGHLDETYSVRTSKDEVSHLVDKMGMVTGMRNREVDTKQTKSGVDTQRTSSSGPERRQRCTWSFGRHLEVVIGMTNGELDTRQKNWK